jgi:hypothetical protein
MQAIHNRRPKDGVADGGDCEKYEQHVPDEGLGEAKANALGERCRSANSQLAKTTAAARYFTPQPVTICSTVSKS